MPGPKMAAKVTISIAEALEIVPEHELKADPGVKKAAFLCCIAAPGLA
ncbi:hypothetical protein BN961_03541 [Afipia felis]|jgi:hypothetical protein|uniref:Uncharacterized protein n=1 Tax=Afipia felis TaxID=1035 RepID=A0A090MUR0_AFIFE|nr:MULTISPECIES: hypothetical protein [Afipia]EFI53503.1 conserved hypothetical protein [Afipia sp. 1NLS2]CEG10107.1 hypothetical protein BN961_03541 [Afipia felis]